MNTWNTILSKISEFKLEKGITSFVNPYSMLLLEKREDIADKINSWYIDGSLLIVFFKIFLQKKFIRYSFDNTSVAPIVFRFAKENNLKIAIVGTKEEHIQNAISNIEKRHKVKIVFYRNGYFNSEAERNECFKQIINKKIDIVICGMGTPYQEEFLIDLVDKGWYGYGFTCGGFLHQTAQKADYYPTFFNKYNIRWIYRILDEHKLLTRYFILYPNFLFRFLFQNFIKK